MSEKTQTTAGTSAAPNTEELLKAALATIEQQKTKLADMESAMRKAQAAAARTAKAEKNAPKLEERPPALTGNIAREEPHNHEHEQPDPSQGREAQTGHLMHKWQRFCTGPNCEGENPDFKDETQCDNCGMHLGSVEVATSLSRCPSCGSKKVKRVDK